MSPVSSEERYQEWLDRMDIPIEDLTDIETLRSYLKDEMGITGDAQVQALWEAAGISNQLSTYGIRAVTVTYPWGNELRYGVQGLPGLWSWASVQTIMAEEAAA